MSSASAFDEHLAREILQSERVRLAIVAGLIAALVAIFAVMFNLYREDYGRQFSSPAAFRNLLLILACFVAYELVVRAVMGRLQRSGRSVPEPLRYLNAFVETSLPSLIIVVVARYTNPMHVLQSGATLLYGVFIVLSTLRLDFRLSAFTGAVAAVEYAVLSYVYLSGSPVAYGTPFGEPPYFLGKAAMLLLAGAAAGFVAAQLKRRVSNAWRAQQERERIVSAFGQQVSPAIVEELLRRGPAIESRRAFVCVMFMDVRNFTPMVQAKSPEEIVAFQNAVFGEAIDVVNRHHGIINQFLGDGFMATFGAPLSGGADCRNALEAARELVGRIEALSAAGRIPPTRIGIGLHAGEAVSGNIGSAQRKQYSITGNVVILAARIEQLNKTYDSQLLVSAEVLAAAGEPAGRAVAIGPVQVKGRDAPIEIYRLA